MVRYKYLLDDIFHGYFSFYKIAQKLFIIYRLYNLYVIICQTKRKTIKSLKEWLQVSRVEQALALCLDPPV